MPNQVTCHQRGNENLPCDFLHKTAIWRKHCVIFTKNYQKKTINSIEIQVYLYLSQFMIGRQVSPQIANYHELLVTTYVEL